MMAQAELNHADAVKALQEACFGGHLQVARLVAEKHALTAADARAGSNYALRFACLNGHLEVAQWLVAEFVLTAEDARASDNWALRHAYVDGHLEVAQWLVEAFGLEGDARNFGLEISAEKLGAPLGPKSASKA